MRNGVRKAGSSVVLRALSKTLSPSPGLPPRVLGREKHFGTWQPRLKGMLFRGKLRR